MKSYYDSTVTHPYRDIDVNVLFNDYPHMHTHDYWEFLIPLTGKYEHNINGKTHEIGKGNICIIRPNDVHEIRKKTEANSHLNIMIKEEAMEKILTGYYPDFLSIVLAQDEIAFFMSDIEVETIEQYVNLYRDNTDEKYCIMISRFLVNTVVNKMFEQLCMSINTRPEWLIKLLSQLYKQENMAWTVQDVLNACGYSHTHLIREFKKYLNCSIVEYLRKVKLSFAIDYLKHSNLNISEISAKLGFSSISHLNHIFKKYTGKSPLEYRKDYQSRTRGGNKKESDD